MPNDRSHRVIDILLVEDNPADVRLTIEALKDSKIANNLHAVQDGVEAMEFLRRQGEYTSAVHPGLILLDLNLPKKNGREVLAEIKEDRNLLRIPVVIPTTSQAEEDILKSYDLHANCYITKPVGFEQLIRVVHSIEHFWLSVVELPPDGDR